MTSFSTYASRFLSSGAATASIQQQFTNQSSTYRPFESSQYPSDLREGEEDQDCEDDVFEITESPPSRRNRHHLPHLSKDNARKQQTRRSTRQSNRNSSIADIDDEEDEENDGRGHEIYHDERSRVAVPSGSSLLDEVKQSKSGARKDEHDPFLAEDDLHIASASTSPTRRIRGPSSEAKARGWMAVADSSSAASTTSYGGANTGKNDLPNDIYRDPDEEDEEEGPTFDKGKGTRKGSPKRDRYSVYDDVDTSDSGSTTSTDDSEAADHDPRRKKWGRARRSNRKAQISKAAGSIGSSLREPLLSSAGSERLAKPPGGFRGQTSRIASTDIYAYPHPPAKAGWTPWAPGNRVSWSEYKDKIALLLWFGLVGATLITAVWMVVGAKVSFLLVFTKDMD